MKGTRAVAVACVVLGFLSVGWLVAAVLALMDISSGEPDLTLEWRIVRAAVFFLALFHVSSFLALSRLCSLLREGTVPGDA
jgi:hypothetical protein